MGFGGIQTLENLETLEHFENFYKNVGYPISVARGAYWLGKTYKKLGYNELSVKWFREASNYLTTYYGQLSHMKIYPNKSFELENLIEVNKNTIEKFNSKKWF